MILIILEKFFFLNSQILKKLVVVELYGKLYEKITKIPLYKKRYKFETRRTFLLKILYDKFKAGDQFVLAFEI